MMPPAIESIGNHAQNHAAIAALIATNNAALCALKNPQLMPRLKTNANERNLFMIFSCVKPNAQDLESLSARRTN